MRSGRIASRQLRVLVPLQGDAWAITFGRKRQLGFWPACGRRIDCRLVAPTKHAAGITVVKGFSLFNK